MDHDLNFVKKKNTYFLFHQPIFPIHKNTLKISWYYLGKFFVNRYSKFDHLIRLYTSLENYKSFYR